MRSSPWTAAEDALFRANIDHPERLAQLLPGRTGAAIKCRKYGLGLSEKRRPWTSEENETFVRLYPNYAALRSAFPTRTLQALKSHARDLDVAVPVDAFWGSELRYLLIDNGRSSPDELFQRFNRHTPRSIKGMRQRLGVKVKKPPAPKRGLFGDVATRAKDIGISLVNLSAQVGGDPTALYARTPTYRVLADAAILLGGELFIEWEE